MLTNTRITVALFILTFTGCLLSQEVVRPRPGGGSTNIFTGTVDPNANQLSTNNGKLSIINGALQTNIINRGNTAFQSIRLTNAAPEVILYDTGADADEKNWTIRAENGELTIFGYNDAGTVGSQHFVLTRNGTVSESITLNGRSLLQNVFVGNGMDVQNHITNNVLTPGSVMVVGPDSVITNSAVTESQLIAAASGGSFIGTLDSSGTNTAIYQQLKVGTNSAPGSQAVTVAGTNAHGIVLMTLNPASGIQAILSMMDYRGTGYAAVPLIVGRSRLADGNMLNIGLATNAGEFPGLTNNIGSVNFNLGDQIRWTIGQNSITAAGNNTSAAIGSDLFHIGTAFITTLYLGANNTDTTLRAGTGVPSFGTEFSDMGSLYFRSDAPDLNNAVYIKNAAYGAGGNVPLPFGSLLAFPPGSKIDTTNGYALGGFTNSASFQTIITNWVLGQRYTNTVVGGFNSRRSTVSSSITCTAAVGGIGQVSLYVENGTTSTNKATVSAEALAGLVNKEFMSLRVGPGDFFVFVDESSGGGSVVQTAGTGSWVGE